MSKLCKKKKMRYYQSNSWEECNSLPVTPLYHGTYKGFELIITDFQHMFPVIDVCIPDRIANLYINDKDEYYDLYKDVIGRIFKISEIPIPYSDGPLNLQRDEHQWLEWDYNKINTDFFTYVGTPSKDSTVEHVKPGKKKWTTEELYLEAKRVINYLRKVKL